MIIHIKFNTVWKAGRDIDRYISQSASTSTLMKVQSTYWFNDITDSICSILRTKIK